MGMDSNFAADDHRSWTAELSRRPATLPEPATKSIDRASLADIESEEFQILKEKFVNEWETVFSSSTRTCSAEEIARWVVNQGYCDSLYQAGPICETLREALVIEPVGQADSFRPGSKVDLYTFGPNNAVDPKRTLLHPKLPAHFRKVFPNPGTDAAVKGEVCQPWTADRVRRPATLPEAETNSVDRAALADIDSEHFQSLKTAFVNSLENVFCVETQTCSAEEIARWIVNEGYCDSFYQAGPIAEALREARVIESMSPVDSFQPSSRLDLYTVGPNYKPF